MQSDEKFIEDLLKSTIDGIEVEEPEINLPDIIPTKFNLDHDTDIDDDYKLVRSTLHAQLQLFNEASRHALIGLIASQHPKSVEAFAALMGQMSATADKILKTQKDVKKIKMTRGGPGGPATPTPAAMTYGTSSDLLDQFGDATAPKYVLDDD